VAGPKDQTIRLSITRSGRRYQLRDDRGVVLETLDSRLAALDLVNAMRREVNPGWRIELTWVGCEAP
jgi:hypothetical protein